MKTDELAKLIKDGETLTVEFKGEKRRHLGVSRISGYMCLEGRQACASYHGCARSGMCPCQYSDYSQRGGGAMASPCLRRLGATATIPMDNFR